MPSEVVEGGFDRSDIPRDVLDANAGQSSIPKTVQDGAEAQDKKEVGRRTPELEPMNKARALVVSSPVQ